MKINNFQGDLTDISAKKEALCATQWFFFSWNIGQVVRRLFIFIIYKKNVFLVEVSKNIVRP